MATTGSDPGASLHLEKIQKSFVFQGYIERTEHRAITVPQLQGILAFATDNCGDWHDTAPETHSVTSGRALAMDFLNLYHLCVWLILPATKEHDCAFVELLVKEEQKPLWFISHWWGEKICDFVSCVAAHAQVRALPKDAAFWCCAYANRQHSLKNEVVADPKETSFFKAMQLAEGVLVVLNEATEHHDASVAFTRIWCAFEEAVALTDANKSFMHLDIAVTTKSKASILTSCPVGRDFRRSPDWAVYLKTEREKAFPIEIMKNALKIKLEEAQASVADDQKHILNCIAERGLDLKPLEKHENYDRVNRRLRALFAVAAWRQAAELGKVGEWGLLDALKEDSGRNSLALDFTSCEQVCAADVSALMASLPSNLQQLNLGFWDCKHVGDEGLTAVARGLRSALRSLKLDFGLCADDMSAGISALHSGIPDSLESLHLSFRACAAINEAAVARLSQGLAASLVHLTLDFRHCELLTDASLAAVGKALPPKLVTFHLDIGHCEIISDAGIVALANGLPSSIRDLHLPLMGCNISDASIVAISAALSVECRFLYLSLSLCADISDAGIAALAAHLPPALEKLFLYLVRCIKVDLPGIAALAAKLPGTVNELAIRIGEWHPRSSSPPPFGAEITSVEEFRGWRPEVHPAEPSTAKVPPAAPPKIAASSAQRAKAKSKARAAGSGAAAVRGSGRRASDDKEPFSRSLPRHRQAAEDKERDAAARTIQSSVRQKQKKKER